MALVLADRVRETTTTAGTGTITLLGAVPSCQSFAAVGNGNTTYYTIVAYSGTEWEVGIGTYTASGTTLSRDTVLSSSNSGSLVNFSAGTKDVFVDYPAGRAVYEDAAGNVDGYPITGGTINNTTIGATTPNTGVFTTLTANTSVTTPIVGAATGSSTTGLDLNVNSKAQARIVEIGDGTRPLVINGGSAGGAQTPGITATTVLAISGGGGNPIRFYTNGRVTTQQAEVSHTASAVNYVQVTGAATGSDPTYSAQGSDSNISLRYLSKGAGEHRFATNTASNIQFRVLHGGSSVVNYSQVYGGATGLAPVISSAGSDTNISQVFQTKGTGAIDLAAGSSGVNISNGRTVTALTVTSSGASYTSIPSVAITAPTTASGVQATANALMFTSAATVANGGTGYAVNDVISIVGGTYTTQGTYTVSAVSGGVITAVTRTSGSGYSVLPTNPVSTTGGTGTGATLNITAWTVSAFTITNAGSGYVEQPTVTFSGGGGSGAAAFARVGGTVSLTSLGSTLNLNTEAGTGFRVLTAGTTATDMWQAISNGTTAILRSSNATSNGQVQTSGTGGIQLGTSSGVTQCLVSHTASAVNYVQVTGAATGNNPNVTAQGSDNNISIYLSSKGTGSVRFFTNGAGSEQFRVLHTAGTIANYLTATGNTTGNAPSFSVAGSDTNIDLNLTTKGTGAVNLNTGGGTQFSVANTASATNYFATTGSNGGTPALYSAGASANIGANFVSKGTGALAFYTNGSLAQAVVAHTASAVNYVQVTGAATGASPTISAQGSDTNIPLTLNSKGNNGIVFQTRGAGTPRVALQLIDSGSASVNYLQIQSNISGAGPVLSALGTDTNIDLTLTPKGTGNVRFGTYTGTALSIAGYIEIKDAGGTVRKLAVVA